MQQISLSLSCARIILDASAGITDVVRNQTNLDCSCLNEIFLICQIAYRTLGVTSDFCQEFELDCKRLGDEFEIAETVGIVINCLFSLYLSREDIVQLVRLIVNACLERCRRQSQLPDEGPPNEELPGGGQPETIELPSLPPVQPPPTDEEVVVIHEE